MENVTLENVAHLAEKLPLEEQLALLEKLAQGLRRRVSVKQKPQDLYGIWQNAFPPNFDIDSVLSEIRNEHKDEFRENS